MQQHVVRTYINEDFIGRGPQHASAGEAIANRYRTGLEPGDYLVPGPILLIAAPDEEHALNRAWHIGNRMEADDEGFTWPSNVRSLSVGDVVSIGESAWTTQAIGWRQLTTEEFDYALCKQCPQCERHAHLRGPFKAEEPEEPEAECVFMGGKDCTHPISEPYTSAGMQEPS